MIRFDVITIFPNLIESYFSEGVVSRGAKAGMIAIQAHDLRQWTEDKHKTVDGKPFSGGPGMVLKIEPIDKAIQELKAKSYKLKSKVILTSARGKRFTQKKAKEYSMLDQLIIICGRYEGVDERVAKYIVDESVSLGDFVLSGGEIAALAVIEATARLVPGVLGNEESPENALFPQYTRPEVFTTSEGKKWRVPKVLLSGNHKEIEEWHRRHSRKLKTKN